MLKIQSVIQDGPPDFVVRPARVCVIASCAYVRTGLGELLSEVGVDDAMLLASPNDGWADDAVPDVLVCYLPPWLGSALDMVFFVAGCLSPERRILLVTELPPCWLVDALRALTEDARTAGSVEVISPFLSVPALRVVLTESRLPLSAQPRRLWRRALTAAELHVLHALLCRCQDFVTVAHVRGTCVNTVKNQKQMAFLKLRVRTWSEVLKWRGDGF